MFSAEIWPIAGLTSSPVNPNSAPCLDCSSIASTASGYCDRTFESRHAGESPSSVTGRNRPGSASSQVA